jgi:hypothetical protein
MQVELIGDLIFGGYTAVGLGLLVIAVALVRAIGRNSGRRTLLVSGISLGCFFVAMGLCMIFIPIPWRLESMCVVFGVYLLWKTLP